MTTISVSKNQLDPISLPGMGRGIELSNLSDTELQSIRSAFSQQELYVQFVEDTENVCKVVQLWVNPHAPQVTMYIK